MKKRGFTLVELLAVLLVLSILALITVPIVTNMIEKARKEAYKRSIEGYARSVELAISGYQIDHPGKSIPTYLSEYTIETNGDEVHCDNAFNISDNGKISLTSCYTNRSLKKYPSLKYSYNAGIVSEQDGYKIYQIGNKIKFGDSYYYVIEQSDKTKDYVTAIKENPLTVDEVNKYGVGHINKYAGYNGTVFNQNGYGGVVYYSSSTCGRNNDNNVVATDCTNEYSASEIKIIIDEWTKDLPNGLKSIDGYSSRLIKLEELINNFHYEEKCENSVCWYDKTDSTPAWIYNSNYWYWTMTKYDYEDPSYIWIVYNDEIIDWSSVYDNNYGVVRPVINVLKSEIIKIN